MNATPLDIEIALLTKAKDPDTPENFASACKQIAELTIPFGAQYVRTFPAGAQIAKTNKPLVAFFVPSTAMLAHAVNLQTLLRGLKQIDSPIQPIVFTFGVPKDSFAQALGVEIHHFTQGGQLERWLDVQRTGHRLGLDALVHVSNPAGLAFAATIRCARKHIWWAMKWHAAIPGLDGYLDGNDPFHSGTTISQGITWRSVYTAFPELAGAGPSADAARKNMNVKTVYCTMARDEKYSAQFLDCVKAILRADPDSIYLYAARNPIPVEREFQGRFIHQGWVKTFKFVHIPDIFLDTFPFGGGHIAFEVIAAGKPIVLMETPESEQLFPANLMKRAGHPVLMAKSKDEYVAQALAYREPSQWPEKYRAFYQTHLRDEQRMAREVSGAIFDVLRT